MSCKYCPFGKGYSHAHFKNQPPPEKQCECACHCVHTTLCDHEEYKCKHCQPHQDEGCKEHEFWGKSEGELKPCLCDKPQDEGLHPNPCTICPGGVHVKPKPWDKENFLKAAAALKDEGKCIRTKDGNDEVHFLGCNCFDAMFNQDEGMEWEDEFDLLWGLAPEESLKGKKGKGIKIFIKHVLAKDRIDTARKIAWAAGQAGLSPRDLANPRNWIEAVAKDRQQEKEKVINEIRFHGEQFGYDTYKINVAILEGEGTGKPE